LPHAVGGFHFNKQMLPPQSVPLIADRLPKGWGLPRLMAVHRRIDDLISFTELSLRAAIVPAPHALGHRQRGEGESPIESGSRPDAPGLTPTEADALRLFELARSELGADPTIAAAWEHLAAGDRPVGSFESFKRALVRARAKLAPARSDAPRSAVPISHFNRADD
jgi:hypothetical protein